MAKQPARTYDTEFPDCPIPALLKCWLATDGREFRDTSWHNNTCPHFECTVNLSDALTFVELWVDYPGPAKREDPTLARYRVIMFSDEDANTAITVAQCEDLAEATDVAAWCVTMLRSVFTDVLRLLLLPTYPELPIRNFSDLHDQVDANTLGYFEEGSNYFADQYPADDKGNRVHRFFDIVGAVQTVVDRWIQTGHHRMNRFKPAPPTAPPNWNNNTVIPVAANTAGVLHHEGHR